MTSEVFDIRQVLTLVPEALHDYTLVAGGYLADPARATDIDVWVLGGTDPTLRAERASKVHGYIAQLQGEPYENCRGLTSTPLPVGWTAFTENLGGEGLSEEYEAGNLRDKGYHFIGEFQHVTWPKKVQLFVAPYEIYSGLLEDFDISTHQLAKYAKFGNDGPMLKMATTTAIDRQPRVTNFSTPSTTLARLERLSSRYGKSLRDNPDYVTLRSKIIEDSQVAA